MEKDVMIRIKGMQYLNIGDDTEPVEIIAPGKYYYKNDSHYLLFEDCGDAPNELCHNMLKFRKSYLEVRRRGYVTTKLLFEENKKTKSIFKTPIGDMNIGISTTSISLKEKQDEIGFTANYALDINDAFIADCSFTLQANSISGGFSLSS